jgi:hypothetical protein
MAIIEQAQAKLGLHEPVELTNDVWGVKAGTRGYIVDAYPDRDSYTVEFLDENGNEIAVIPLERRYLRPLLP